MPRVPSLRHSVTPLLLSLLSFGAALAAEVENPPPVLHPESPPLSPGDALASIHVRDGFKVELVAAEPLVQDPTAIAWGADGKLWVAEMADYPLGPGAKYETQDAPGEPGGRIRFLEDTDGDGRYDSSTVFLDEIAFPNGVMPWRNGVLVTSAPEVFFAEDTDGDGRANVRETLFTGFHAGNQQLRLNGLRWGLDNWVYCANGSHRAGYGGDVRVIFSPVTGKEIDLGSRDFRFHPDTGEIDPQSGPTQFGRDRDDWGNWFGTMNSYPLWHFVLRDHYIRRNPHVASPDPRVQLVLPRNPKVYPAKEPQKRYHSFTQSGRFTSACSGMIYRDELLFPRDGTLHAFTCEPFHNLVQHNVLTENGITFAAHRDEKEGAIDFFASTDRWSRPVMVRTGPDGALWIVDMYRYIIEHPQFLTDEGRRELEPHYRAGHEYGRIYRVFPAGEEPRPFARLDTLEIPELVAALDNPNGEQRDTAQQLLVWRNDRSAAPLLENLFYSNDNPLARLHALCTLDGLDALSGSLLMEAVVDVHPGVRRQAMRLTETRFEELTQPADIIINLIALETDPKALLQLANSAGFWPPEVAGFVLGALAANYGTDPYVRAAILSSVTAENLEKAVSVMGSADEGAEGSGLVLGEFLALSVVFGKPDVTLSALDRILSPGESGAYSSRQQSIVAGLLDALTRKKQSLAGLEKSAGDSHESVFQRVDSLIEGARRIALEPSAPEPARVAALRLMARDQNPENREKDIVALANLLTPQTPLPVQIAAVNHLGGFTDKNIAALLFENWARHGAAVRAEILEVAQSRLDWLHALLDEVESGDVPPADIDPATRQGLVVYPNKALRDRVELLFAASLDPDRQRILTEFQPALELEGNPAHGAEIFKARCATCHQLNGEGFPVGPDLKSITDRKPATLLNSIIDPSASVDAKFINYVALAADGRAFSGFLASETGTSITLQGPAEARGVILRQDLTEFRSTAKSMMPDGLETDLSHQDMADLLGYLEEVLEP